jgi:hypothetical protein
MYLMQALIADGIPPSLLCDLLSPDGPESADICRLEAQSAATVPIQGNPQHRASRAGTGARE